LSGPVESINSNKSKKYRYLVISHYKIYFSLRNGNVFIQTIFDCKQNPKKLKKALKE